MLSSCRWEDPVRAHCWQQAKPVSPLRILLPERRRVVDTSERFADLSCLTVYVIPLFWWTFFSHRGPCICGRFVETEFSRYRCAAELCLVGTKTSSNRCCNTYLSDNFNAMKRKPGTHVRQGIRTLPFYFWAMEVLYLHGVFFMA